MRDINAWIPRLLKVWRRAAGEEAVAKPVDRLSGEELARVGRALNGLSEGLTRGRRLAGADYMGHPDLLGAYLLWFWPVSYLQARAVLAEARIEPKGWALDLGAGPGPVAEALADHGFGRVLAGERSPEALALLRRVDRLAGGRVQAFAWEAPTPGDEPVPGLPGMDGPLGVVSLGHVVNELYLDQQDPLPARKSLLRALAGLLGPEGSLMVLEPALMATARPALALRDALVAGGLSVRWPCLLQGPCPALAADGQTCHSEFAWSQPPLVAQLASRAGFKKDKLKAMAAVFGPAIPFDGFRVVGDPLLSKNGTRRIMVCGAAGRHPLALRADATAETKAAFGTLARGDLARAQQTEPRENGLALGAQSRLQVKHACRPLGDGPNLT